MPEKVQVKSDEDLQRMMAASIQRSDEQLKIPAAVRYRVPDAIWAHTEPTFIENWPAKLRRLSIASQGIALSERATRFFGSEFAGFGQYIENPPTDPAYRKHTRAMLIHEMDRILKCYPEGGFVRLGSRSPKDSYTWGIHPDDDENGRVRTGEQAWRRITGDSERMYHDVQSQLAMGHKTHIWIRQWVDIPEWTEFRCFIGGGHLLGISQYNHSVFPEIAARAEQIKEAITAFFDDKFKPVSHLDSVVLDVFLQPTPGQDEDQFVVRMLEINPFLTQCDPCLFNWNELFKRPECRLRYVQFKRPEYRLRYVHAIDPETFDKESKEV